MKLIQDYYDRRLPTAAARTTSIRVLILEDNVHDAEMMVAELGTAGFEVNWERVATEREFANQLPSRPDLILSDYSLPDFDGIRALRLVRSRGDDTPFILVSGSIGEDIAVDAMRNGADDYLLKDRTARLGYAVRQALEKKRLRDEASRAEAAHRESERRFGDLLANVELVSLMLDCDARITYCNDYLLRLTGWRREEVMGCNWFERFLAPPHDKMRATFSALLADRPAARHHENEILTRSGARRLIHWSNSVLRSAQGEVIGAASIGEDITEREKLSRIRTVSGEVNAAIVRIRDRGSLLRETCRITEEIGGFEFVWIAAVDAGREDVHAICWAGFSDDAARAVSWRSIMNTSGPLARAVASRKPQVTNDIETQTTGGSLRAEALAKGCRSSVCLPLLVDDVVVALIFLFAAGRGFFDRDELALLDEVAADLSLALLSAARQERLDFLSYYDPLTGLPNRTLFLDRAGQQLHARGGERLLVAMVLVNLERFRNINETFGRDGGDQLLRLVARRLEQAFHGKDYLARIGADGFAVVMRGLRDAAAVAHAIESQVMECFREPFALGGSELRAGAKAGIALYPADGGNIDTLLRNAEAALKNARESRERYLFYAAEMNARAAQALSLETRLRKAVEAQQFVLHYQPKIRLSDGAICGLEALIRWQEPGAGLVPPGHFIPLLEETGLILEVGEWALARALADHRVWTEHGLEVPRVAVNVSTMQLQRRDFTNTVIDVVQQQGDGADALELEVTESLIMKDIQASTSKLSILRGLGIRIAMDDFGTGYSSLSYIARLPIDSVKIDRSFINAMAGNPQDMAIVSTIVTLAHSLKLKVVAEGVETEDQAKLLMLLGCDEAQGFLYSRPVPATEIEPMLQKG